VDILGSLRCGWIVEEKVRVVTRIRDISKLDLGLDLGRLRRNLTESIVNGDI
jgi:hypothetical protein